MVDALGRKYLPTYEPRTSHCSMTTRHGAFVGDNNGSEVQDAEGSTKRLRVVTSGCGKTMVVDT